MGFNPHQSAIDELMKHLDKSDDDDLGTALKPKSDGLEVMKLETSGDPEEAAESPEEESKEPKLSDEEIQELIEALQQTLGSGAHVG